MSVGSTQTGKNSSDARIAEGHVLAARSATPAGGHTAAPAGTPNMALILHRGLRGRYAISIVLGVLVGALAAAATWRFVKPNYRSEGLLRVAYSLPEVITETDQNRPMLMFDTFMQSQKMLISSRRVMDSAVTDPVWATMKRAVPDEPDYYFANHLKVDVSPRSEYIAISVTDSDPATAAAAVNSVINAYVELYNEQQGTLERQRLGVLDAQFNNLEVKCGKLDQELREGEKEFGTTDLSTFYTAAVARDTKLAASLDEIRAAIAGWGGIAATQPASEEGATASAGATTRPAIATAEPLSVQQIAATDPVMQGYLAEQSQLENQLQDLQLKYGEAYPQLVTARRALDRVHRKMDEYAQMYRQFHAATSQNLGGPKEGPVLTAGKSLDTLRQNEASLTELYQKAHEAMIKLGVKQGELRRKRDDLTAARDEQDHIKHRKATLTNEGQLGSRLSIVGTGEVPLSPERDRRPMIAAAAAATGLCLPAGVFFLLSMVFRKYRYSDEAEHATGPQRMPLLGILPEIGDGDEPEEMAAAAHSVHQLRVSLNAKRRSTGGAAAYLITSAMPGEGKTSLAMSLGLSCATSRIRTLIIDGDLVGRKLTTTLQARDFEGLHEAVATGTLRHRVRKTDTGLFILPAGKGASADASSLSGPVVRSILEEARRYFDVILIDSGPILGSVEAAVFAQEVDGVIFTISRGRSRHVVDRGLGRLRALGANVVGCIFNRAHPEDFDGSPYGSSSRSSSQESPAAAAQSLVRHRAGQFNRFGFLVQAVAAGMPVGQN